MTPATDTNAGAPFGPSSEVDAAVGGRGEPDEEIDEAARGDNVEAAGGEDGTAVRGDAVEAAGGEGDAAARGDAVEAAGGEGDAAARGDAVEAAREATDEPSHGQADQAAREATDEPSRDEADQAAREATDEPFRDQADEPDEPDEPRQTLSPAVRRLVRQYEIDITGVRGTGPEGRIRVGDVMAFLGGRTYVESDAAAVEHAAETVPAMEQRAVPAQFEAAHAADAADEATRTEAELQPAAVAPAQPAAVSTLFECDMSNVLAHRRRQREEHRDSVLTSYFLVACSEALRAVPEAGGTRTSMQLGVISSTPQGGADLVTIDAAEDSPLQTLNERLRVVDAQLRSSRPPRRDASRTALLVHHHGLGGSVFAAPTPIGDGHAASIGIGRVRREIVIRETNGEEAPRVAPLCYVTMSFHAEKVELHRANRFLSQLTRVLEQWPQ
jgi:2-oxoglutarate dehydrogenase E2 component (dihydrolipoamide succinyltransferase)